MFNWTKYSLEIKYAKVDSKAIRSKDIVFVWLLSLTYENAKS